VTTPPTAAVALPGALVTAQVVPAPSPSDEKDRVVVEAGTVANDTGDYSLFLMPGSYNLVATKEGYLPDCAAVSLAAGAKPTVDFNLAAVASPLGTIAGTVIIVGVDVDQYASIDFRQAIDCGSGATTVSVNSVNVGSGGSYAVSLPAGSYQVVASTYGKTTQTATVTVIAGGTSNHPIMLGVTP
jgi:hypothetical protein